MKPIYIFYALIAVVIVMIIKNSGAVSSKVFEELGGKTISGTAGVQATSSAPRNRTVSVPVATPETVIYQRGSNPLANTTPASSGKNNDISSIWTA